MAYAHRQNRSIVALSTAVLAGVLLSGCDEHLPAYERPEIHLQAAIYIETPMDLNEGPSDRVFGLDVTNVTGAQDPTQQAVLEPPYEIEVSVTVSLAEDPSRNILVVAREDFEDPVADLLEPGRTIRIVLPFPLQDNQGRNWDWPNAGEESYELVLQGTAEIQTEMEDFILHTEPFRTELIYPDTRP